MSSTYIKGYIDVGYSQRAPVMGAVAAIVADGGSAPYAPRGVDAIYGSVTLPEGKTLADYGLAHEPGNPAVAGRLWLL